MALSFEMRTSFLSRDDRKVVASALRELNASFPSRHYRASRTLFGQYIVLTRQDLTLVLAFWDSDHGLKPSLLGIERIHRGYLLPGLHARDFFAVVNALGLVEESDIAHFSFILWGFKREMRIRSRVSTPVRIKSSDDSKRHGIPWEPLEACVGEANASVWFESTSDIVFCVRLQPSVPLAEYKEIGTRSYLNYLATHPDASSRHCNKTDT
jgi:hypothetical protein